MKLRELLQRFLRRLSCMERKWQVVAVYQPLPRTVVRFDRYSVTREEVMPPGAGLAFKFTVIAADGLGAVEIAKRSGFFCGDMAKQFGFVAVERFE